jgi:ABC-type uncharacterized transport system auxiliary subunit
MKAKHLSFAASLLLLVSGCADLLKQPYPAKDYFGIEPGVPNIKRHQPSTQTADNNLMVVHTVRVTAPYNGVELIYKVGPSHFTADYYSNWIAEPSALLTAGLSQWLDDFGPLTVVPAGSSARPEWILDCDVTRLQIDKTGSGQPRAVIAAHMFLIHQSGPNMNIVADVAYQEQSQASAEKPEAYAEAFGKAYRQILIKFSSDLKTAVSP